MKLFLLLSFTLLLSFSFISCDKNSSTEKKSTVIAPEENCLPGTWKVTEGGTIKLFTFQDDQTGFEKQGEDDPSAFTWQLKDNKAIIKYTGQSNEWTLNLNCKAKELSVFGLIYKKD